MLLALLLACPASDDLDSGKDDSGLAADSGDGNEDTATFDEDCFAQVMKSQVVCECPELKFDWSGLTADSAGAAFGPDDVEVVHWYIFEMPVSSVNGALCAGDRRAGALRRGGRGRRRHLAARRGGLHLRR